MNTVEAYAAVATHVALCASIIGMVWYRVLKSKQETFWRVKFSLGLVAGAAFYAGYEAIVDGLSVTPAMIALEATFAALMFASNPQWANGSPREITHPSYKN